jgi:tricorn protease
MERDPQWSPDGRFIAYLSDESGEYALHVHPQTGSGEVKKIDLKPGFYRLPRFSPDSRKVALVDSFQRLWYVDLESGKQVEVAQDTYQMRAGDIAGAWSPDSKWLAYSKVLPNELSAIHLYSLADGKSTQVTDGLSDATNPMFDKDGKYLFFTASTNSGESLGLDIHAVEATATSSIYLAVLDKTQPSPFARESDEEKVVDQKGDGTKTDGQAPDKPSDGAKPKAEAAGVKDIKVDLDGIDQRILSVPMPPRRYMALQVGKAGTLLAVEALPPGENGDGPGGLAVHRYDFKTRKSDVALTRVSSFQMSFGGEKALYRQGDNWIIASLRPAPSGPGGAGGGATVPTAGGGGNNQGALKTSDIEVQVDPVQEWGQMYREAWRIERDWISRRRRRNTSRF